MPAASGNGRKWDMRQKIMKTDQLKSWPLLLHWILRLILGLTFIWASWPKMAAPGEFAKIIYGYGVFPGFSINLIAIFFPYLEFLAGVCLVTGILPRSSLLIINGLLTAFIVLIGFNLFRGHVFDCGCFSVSGTHTAASAWFLLIRDFFLLATGIFLWAQFKFKRRAMIYRD
jgi:putative oxidoreductase